MSVMKTAVNEVIDMVSMRNRLVAAAWAVTVSITANLGSAFDGVGTADVDDVLVDLSVTGMMQAAVMKVVNVVAVANCHMSAVGAVPVCGAGHCRLRGGVRPRLNRAIITKARKRGRNA